MSAASPKNFIVWIVLALLIVGLMGFGATGISGGRRDLGQAGDKGISLQTYTNALSERLMAERAADGSPMSIATAQANGITEQVLARVVTNRVLDNETAQLGLSVGDEAVRDQIVASPAFQGLNGQFDRDAYAYQLERTGLTEAQFEGELRDELSRGLLQSAVFLGVSAPASLRDAIITFADETRTVTWAPVTEANLTQPIPTPDDATLRAYHTANADTFMAPETRRISAAVLLPERLQDTVTVDEDALRALYDERADEFARPERRLVERLVFADQAQADAAMARIASGEADFEALVTERGLALHDVDLGDQTRDDLGGAADAVFAAAVGDVAGPAPSRLGPALFRINAVLNAETTSFEDARPALREELAAEAARRQIAQAREGLTDLLAGGARLEDLAERSDMELESFDWTGNGMDGGLAAYAAIDDAIPTLEQGALPELIELDDGGLAALRLDNVTPPAPLPFEDSRDAVETAWRAEELTTRLAARTQELVQGLNGGASFEELGLTPETIDTLRRSDVIAAAPNGFLGTAFDTAEGAVAHVSAAGEDAVLRVDAITKGSPDSEELAAPRAQLDQSLSQAIANDIFGAFARDVQVNTDVTVDRAAIDAVHARFR